MMMFPSLIVLLSSSLVSASGLLCQDSKGCNAGSKRCELFSGEQWCCKEKTLLCNEYNQCSFLLPYLPFIQLRPGRTEPLVEDKSLFSKSPNRKSKYSILNNLLTSNCKRLDGDETAETLKLRLDAPNWKTNATDIFCPGRKQRCPSHNTCCRIDKEKYGCCRYTDAVCCPDLIHCCPPGTECHTETMECTSNKSQKIELIR